MTKLLIQGEVILAKDVVDQGDEIHSPDQIVPKHVVPGWQIVDVDVPDGFRCSAYTWNGAEVVAKPPVPEPVVVPQSVSRAQGLAALEMAGKLSTIEAFMADPVTPKLMKIAFENAQTFERDSPNLLLLVAMLGMTDSEVDTLFIEASKVRL